MYQQREIGHFVKDLLHLHSFQDTTYYSVKSRKIFFNTMKYQIYTATYILIQS